MPVSQSSAVDSLAQEAHAEGGWGYTPGQDPQLEPTCFALLALSSERNRFAATLAKGREFLDGNAGSDGAYRIAHGREEAIWPTALVLLVQDVLEYPPEIIRKTASRLLKIEGKVPASAEAGEFFDIDLSIVGWPWSENNFAWVEPTAWACLALRRVGLDEHPRVKAGLRLLLDRAMDEGGINYGNRYVLDKKTDPIPTPTALMLLAIQPHGPQPVGLERHPRVTAAVEYLKSETAGDDLEHLCWAKLALEPYRNWPGVDATLGRLNHAIGVAFEGRSHIAFFKPNLQRVALTALAMANSNVFRVTARDATTVDNGDRLSTTPSAATKKTSWSQRVGSYFKGLAMKAVGNLRPLPAQSSVHIAKAANYDADLASILEYQYEYFRTQVPLAGKRVVLKPNLVEFHRDKVINTNPKVVGAVIELCKREGAKEIIVAEGPGHWRNVEYLVRESGLGDVLQTHGVTFVDLNHDEPVKVPNLGRLTGMEFLYLAQTVATAEVLISLPKLKTHHWAGATLSLKNLFGTLPGICYGWPKNELHWRGIDNSIVDIALTRTPELAIVDGIIGMEGDGPLNGTAKPMGVLVMGHDLLAVDATCCRLMKLDPEKIGYLVLGQQKKLGRMKERDIKQLGEMIAKTAQPFETVPHLNNLRLRASA